MTRTNHIEVYIDRSEMQNILHDKGQIKLITFIKSGKRLEALRLINSCRRYSAIGNNVDHNVNAKIFLRENPDNSIFAQAKTTLMSPVHFAAQVGDELIVRSIIQRAIDLGVENYVNIIDGFGRTALHYAVEFGHSSVAELLIINFGADKTIRNVTGDDCGAGLMQSVFKRDIFDLLIDNIDDKRLNVLVENALHLAIKMRDVDNVRRLCQVPFIRRDQRGNLPSTLAKKYKLGSHVALELELIEEMKRIANQSFAKLLKLKEQNVKRDKTALGYLNKIFKYMEEVYEKAVDIKINEQCLYYVFELIGTLAHEVSYVHKGKYFDKVPMALLSELRVLVFDLTFESKNSSSLNQNIFTKISEMNHKELFGHLKDSVMGVIDGYKEIVDSSLEPALSYNENFRSLNLLFLKRDYESLGKIINLLGIVDNIDLSVVRGRYAFFGVVKNIGELTKFTPQCPNLSGYTKSLLNIRDIADMKSLRDICAKLISSRDRDVRVSYFSLLLSSDMVHLEQLKENLMHIKVRAIQVRGKIEKDLLEKTWLLSNGLFNEDACKFFLPTDLSMEINNEAALYKQIALNLEVGLYSYETSESEEFKVGDDESITIADSDSESSGSFADIRYMPRSFSQSSLSSWSSVEELLVEDIESTDTIFSDHREISPDLDDMFDRSDEPCSDGTIFLGNDAIIGHKSLAELVQDITKSKDQQILFLCQLGKVFLLGDEKCRDRVANGFIGDRVLLDELNYEDLRYIVSKSSEYADSPELVQTLSHIFTDLYQILPDEYKFSKGDDMKFAKNLRNFYEHMNSILVTSSSNISSLSFTQMLSVIATIENVTLGRDSGARNQNPFYNLNILDKSEVQVEAESYIY